MTNNDEAEIVRLMYEARMRDRGYASFFGWQTNRELEELHALKALAESLKIEGKLFFNQIQIRGRGNDPPDLEARDTKDNRIAFEITELVDGEAIKAFKAGRIYEWAQWSKENFLFELEKLLNAKANRFTKLKGGPYPGGYVVVIFTDELELRYQVVRNFLEGHLFMEKSEISRAFLILSYDPELNHYPYFELMKVA